MNYCSNCGSSELSRDIPEGDNRLRVICSNCLTIHYENPKIVTGCLPVWEGQILLCRRAIEPRVGYWNLPSGYLEHGETAEEGAERELWEEAEAKIRMRRLHAVYSIPHIGQIYLHFLGELVDGAYGVGAESLESQLFRPEEIPWDDIAFTSTAFSLRRYLDDQEQGREETHIGGFQNK